MKLWQNAMILSVRLALRVKNRNHPLPPPIGSVVSEFLNTCSNPKNLMMLKFTEG